MTDIASLGFSIDSAPLTKGSAELDKIAAAAKRAEDAATGMGSRVQEAAKKAEAASAGAGASAANLGASYGNLEIMARRAAAAVGLIAAVLASGALTGLVDVYSDLNARVGLAVRNMEASGVGMDRLAVIARRTYSSLELTAEAFVRNAGTLRQLGKSTAEQLDYTEALNLALVVSGAKADRARMLQESMARAMAGGALRGQELNTVIESGGRVAEVLAEELGVGTNQLRRLGEQGKITGDVMYNALTKRLVQLQEEAEKMPATIGDALLIMRNSFLQLIGVYDQSNKLSEDLALAIIGVADSLGVLVKAAGVAAVGLALAFSASLLAGAKALALSVAVGLVGAFNALRLAMAAHPILLFAQVLGTVATAAYMFRDEIRQADSALKPFGDAIDWLIDKLYMLGDVYRAVLLKINSEQANPDAFRALRIQRSELEKTLVLMRDGRDAALSSGGDTSGFEQQIQMVTRDIYDVGVEYRRLEEIRENAELSFTEIVAKETAKRREMWAWERGTTVEKNLGLDDPGTASPTAPDTKAYDKRVEAVRRQVEAMRIEAETYGMTEVAAARYRAQKELENEAIKAGIELTAARRVEILAEADALAVATAAVDARRAVDGPRTEYAAEQEGYEKRLAALSEFEATRTLTSEEAAALRYKIEEEHALAVLQLHAQTASRVAGTLDALVSAMDTSGKKQFEQAKKLSIASAVLKGFESAVSSYAAGAKIGGPPLGAAWAAISIASTTAQIAKIKSTSFNSSASSSGGGGGASAAGSEAPSGQQQQKQAQPTTIHVTLTGSRYSREEVRELLEEINAAQGDGMRLVATELRK